jgi:hypothetical protein
MPTESELDHLFWNAINMDSGFRAWFLERTKFAGRPLELKSDEDWHQRWYKDPETKKGSETDITLIFRDSEFGHLVSIHIENKTPRKAWEKNQAESYRKRAANRMIKWKHVECEVALMAPRDYISSHPVEVSHFDFVITYEEVGVYAPEFKDACL